MQFRRQTKNEESINLTPLIDVVFLLLIFFMVSTTFTKETHIKLQLPEAEGDPAPERPEQIEVTINAEGAYAINGNALVNAEIQTVVTALEKLGPVDASIPFIITADAKVAYDSVVTIMDAAGRVGYTNLSMTTRRPEEEAAE